MAQFSVRESESGELAQGPPRHRRAGAKARGSMGTGGATTGYESELWRMADTLRGSMDAAEYIRLIALNDGTLIE